MQEQQAKSEFTQAVARCGAALAILILPLLEDPLVAAYFGKFGLCLTSLPGAHLGGTLSWLRCVSAPCFCLLRWVVDDRRLECCHV